LEYTEQIVPVVKERVKLLSTARDMMGFFYLAEPLELDVDELLGKPFKDFRQQARLLLSEALVLAEGTEEWGAEPLEQAYRAFAEQNEVKFRDFAGLIRVAITGRSVSPPLFESMEILGRERCVLRLRDSIHLL
jgi:glutamyl-tRNA synthetase